MPQDRNTEDGSQRSDISDPSAVTSHARSLTSTTQTFAYIPPGMVTRVDAARMLGVSKETLMRWDHEGRVAGGAWFRKGLTGRSRIYPIEVIERLKGQMPDIQPDVPEGFVDQNEAARILGVTVGTLGIWRRSGRIDFERWGRSRTNKPCRMYAIEDLRRLMERMQAPDQAYREPGKRGKYRPPQGFVRGREAWRMFGVDHATWHRWELEGKITCGLRINGGGPKIYPIEELNRLLEECGKYSPPYPDPERPGVYRVPLSGRDMHRREAIIDATDLPLVEGKRWTWSGCRPDQPGQVVISSQSTTLRLRQVVIGVSGIEWRVGHRNGDPLDCRRENLFMRTKQEQGRGNRKMKRYAGKPCSSRFKGVCWEKWTGKWRAAIVVDGITRRLGRYGDELAAAEAYDEAARELFGEHARLNFPDGIDAWLARDELSRAARDELSRVEQEVTGDEQPQREAA